MGEDPRRREPTWHRARLSAVRGFAVWAQAFDADIQVPPTGLLPMRTTQATPYLYSQDQICTLTCAAARLVPPVKAATGSVKLTVIPGGPTDQGDHR